jgi:hypothetical protein
MRRPSSGSALPQQTGEEKNPGGQLELWLGEKLRRESRLLTIKPVRKTFRNAEADACRGKNGQ